MTTEYDPNRPTSQPAPYPARPKPAAPHPAPDATDQDASTKSLAELHTRLVDTIKGFDAILEKAEPEFKPVAAEFRALHIRHAATVASMLETDGRDPADGGSIFGNVNRMVVTVRSWFDDISVNIMDSVINGEKHVLEAYDDVLRHTLEEERRHQLSDDRAALIDLLDRHAST